MSLIESTLIAHAKLTRDVGASMSLAMLAHRQIWLAQTSLPENMKKDLTNMSGSFIQSLGVYWKRQRSPAAQENTFNTHSAGQVVPDIDPEAHSLRTRKDGEGCVETPLEG